MPTVPEPNESAFPTASDRFFRALSTPTRSSSREQQQERYHFITGYKYAADVLVTHLVDAPRFAYKLGPPIVFLYRHHLELALKDLARRCGAFLERDVTPPLHHRLNDLWRLCLALLEEKAPGNDETTEVQQATRLLDEFSRVDLKSETFRYPDDKDGNPRLVSLDEIDVDRIQDVVGKISLLLDCISSDLSTRE